MNLLRNERFELPTILVLKGRSTIELIYLLKLLFNINYITKKYLLLDPKLS